VVGRSVARLCCSFVRSMLQARDICVGDVSAV
jgi:hypothetical protein